MHCSQSSKVLGAAGVLEIVGASLRPAFLLLIESLTRMSRTWLLETLVCARSGLCVYGHHSCCWQHRDPVHVPHLAVHASFSDRCL